MGLDQDRIVRSALELIDERGLSAFSMRKLGTHLGVDPMAAYRHFRNQEDLFDGVAALMLDEADLAELPWQGAWPELIRDYADRLRTTLLAHPEAVPIFATRPVRSASAIETGVRTLSVLSDAGIPEAAGLQVHRCVTEFVIGHVMALTADRTRSRTPSPGDAAHNALAVAAASTPRDAHFRLGVDSLLHGMAHLLEPGRPPHGQP